MPWKNKEDKRKYDRAWRNKKRLALRKLVYDRDGGRCTYCRRVLTLEKSTLDHYIPKALEGSKDISNLRLSCFKCNRHKWHLPPEAFECAFYDDYERLRIQQEERMVRDGC